MSKKLTPFCGLIANNRHVIDVRVYYADTDFSGLVYHGRYLEFLERGRSELLRLCGIFHHELVNDDKSQSRAWVVRHMAIDFLSPARIDDILTVTTRVKAISGARLLLEQSIEKGLVKIITAQAELALINGYGQPRRFERPWLALFAQFMEKNESSHS